MGVKAACKMDSSPEALAVTQWEVYEELAEINMSKKDEWIRDRAALIKDAVLSGRIVVRYKYGFPEGICEDCHEWKQLDLDHRLKRSQGGKNDKSNIDWVCRECHDRRDNQGDPMKKKETNKGGKKANWQLPHHCKACGRIVSMFLCNHCGKASA
jgi:hypothetical protein